MSKNLRIIKANPKVHSKGVTELIKMMYQIEESLFFRFVEKKFWLKTEPIKYYSRVQRVAKNIESGCNLELEHKVTI